MREGAAPKEAAEHDDSPTGNGSGAPPGALRRLFLLPRQRHHRVRLIIAVVLLILTALPVRRHSVAPLETEVFRALNGLPGWLFPPVWAVMQLGNLLAVPVVALAALAWRRVRLALDLLIAGTAGYLLALEGKQIVVRGRPAQLLDHVILRQAPVAGHGYISGHSATAVALATVASSYLGRRGRIIAWALAVTVCLARVYVGAHLPLDVVGGAAMGWAVGSLVHAVIGAPDLRGR